LPQKKKYWKNETETIYNKYGMGKTFGMTENWGRLGAPNIQFVYSISSFSDRNLLFLGKSAVR